MKRGWILGAAAVAAALAAGCAAPNTAGITVGVEADADGNLQQVLQVDNAKLAKSLKVEEAVVGQTKNGLMKVNVKLTSRQNKDVDADTDPWRPLVLHGKETRSLQGVAPGASAVSFKLRVRAGEKTRWIIK